MSGTAAKHPHLAPTVYVFMIVSRLVTPGFVGVLESCGTR